MTKADMIQNIADKNGFTAKDVKLVVEEFIDQIKGCLASEQHLEIRGFGTFKVKAHKARKARNPKTNEEVKVPARKKAFFKVSRELNGMLK